MKSVLDTHVHSVASGHAYSTVKEIFDAAAAKGLRLLALTDHGPQMPGACTYMNFLNLKSVLPAQINGVELLAGAELNILNENGDVDLGEKTLRKLDVVIASLHVTNILPGPEVANTAAVMNAMENPFVRIIGHLGDPRYPVDIGRVVRRAKDTGTAIEINEKSADPDSGIRSGGIETLKEIIRECNRLGVPMTLGSDAHYCADAGVLSRAEALAAECGLTDGLVLNYSMERFKDFIFTPKRGY